jgi:hypothetical protein
MKLNLLTITLPYVLLIILTMVGTAQAARTDIVVLHNGDGITGEIKELKYARLKFKTDDAGTIYIEWKKVVSLKSKHNFVVATQDGEEYFGTIDSDSTAKRLLVITKDRTVRLEPILVVEIIPVKNRFWSRFDAAVSLGLNYTKASKVGQLNLGGDVSYRTKKILSEMELSSIITFQEDRDNTERDNLISTTIYTFSRPWATGGKIGLEKITELGVNLRLLLGGAIGRYLIQTNVSQLTALCGLQFNEEWMTDGGPGQSNLEGSAALDFHIFRYDTPELDFATGFHIYPSLTPVSRVRGDFEIDFKWELVEDLFWNLEFFYEFDSEPPSIDAANSDWGIVLSIGWST